MPTLTAQDLAAIGMTKGTAAPLLRACAELKAHATKRGATGTDFVPRRISVQSGESGAAAMQPKSRPTSISRGPPPETPPSRGLGSGRSQGKSRATVSPPQPPQDRDSEPLYENVSFCRDAGGNVQAVIDGVALSPGALQYISEPEPRRAMTGLGVGEDGLNLMLQILERQEENECKQIEARYRRMKQRINRVCGRALPTRIS